MVRPAERPSRRCPSCHQPMARLWCNAEPLERCMGCRLTWLDEAALELIVPHRQPPTFAGNPVTRCPACGSDLWPAQLTTGRALSCAGCGGVLISDERLSTLSRLGPSSKIRFTFLCLVCRDRYDVAEARLAEGGLACARCVTPPSPRSPRPTPGRDVLGELSAFVLDVLALFR